MAEMVATTSEGSKLVEFCWRLTATDQHLEPSTKGKMQCKSTRKILNGCEETQSS